MSEKGVGLHPSPLDTRRGKLQGAQAKKKKNVCWDGMLLQPASVLALPRHVLNSSKAVMFSSARNQLLELQSSPRSAAACNVSLTHTKPLLGRQLWPAKKKSAQHCSADDKRGLER